MIAEHNFRMVLSREREEIRKNNAEVTDYVRGILYGLFLSDKLLTVCARSTRKGNVDYPQQLRFELTNEMYIAIQTALNCFSRGGVKMGINRLKKAKEIYDRKSAELALVGSKEKQNEMV